MLLFQTTKLFKEKISNTLTRLAVQESSTGANPAGVDQKVPLFGTVPAGPGLT